MSFPTILRINQMYFFIYSPAINSTSYVLRFWCGHIFFPLSKLIQFGLQFPKTPIPSIFLLGFKVILVIHMSKAWAKWKAGCLISGVFELILLKWVCWQRVSALYRIYSSTHISAHFQRLFLKCPFFLFRSVRAVHCFHLNFRWSYLRSEKISEVHESAEDKHSLNHNHV